LFPEEPFERGHADAVVKGDGDVAWGQVLRDLELGRAKRIYEGGKIEGEEFLAARWDLMQTDKYMWASVQTIRGCPKHCSFCSVWRTDGQKPRQRTFENVIDEIIDLRRRVSGSSRSRTITSTPSPSLTYGSPGSRTIMGGWSP
jgi:radical SAM superfamily enzyme YgiQ (UPF0313 family)